MYPLGGACSMSSHNSMFIKCLLHVGLHLIQGHRLLSQLSSKNAECNFSVVTYVVGAAAGWDAEKHCQHRLDSLQCSLYT